ncbi:MAG: hypothetical protein Ta2F_17710 [Termitinemataceae bacterium]|nr:MAG: hypothetical protein Ta2F_17710 [Termitinemataceae bacterium]
MQTITLELDDDVVFKAKEKGVSLSAEFEAYIRKLFSNEQVFDKRLTGAVSPALFGKGEICGDIVGPFNAEWE